MSKPNKPGELVNVEVEAISMVSKAANGERFKIFKSAEEFLKPEQPGQSKEVKETETVQTEQVPEPTADKNEVEKGAVRDVYNAGQNAEKLNEVFDALRKVLKLGARYENPKEQPETDANKIREALDDFRTTAGEILLGNESIVKDQPEQVIKAGRKISGSRLARLREAQSILNEVLDGVDDSRDEITEIAEVFPENIQKAIADALKPISEKVNGLNVEGVIKEALTPIITRIEKIENARGFSNRALESKQIEKSSASFWDGAF